jgi:hypothetical protein
MRHMLYFVILAGCLVGSANAQQNELLELRVASIRNAAIKIATIQRQEGNSKAMSLVNECHRHIIGTKSEFDFEGEACLVTDYFVTTSSVAYFSQMSEEFRQKNNLDTNRMKKEMEVRISAMLQYYKVPPSERKYFVKLLRENVMQAALEDRASK